MIERTQSISSKPLKNETLFTSDSISIFKAIEIIDAHSYQCIIIVDINQKLLGIVTDGDIRRGILKGISLDAPIRKIMNKKPHTADTKTSSQQIFNIMKKNNVRQIPIIDTNNIVQRVDFFSAFSTEASYENPVIIMAGGLGKRLRPLTTNKPKPLLKIGNKSVLEITLERLINNGFENFFITVNYLSNMIIDQLGSGEKWGVNISYIHESKRLGTAGALSLFPKKTNFPLIVMNGDLITKVNFRNMLLFHQQNNVAATMGVKQYTFTVPYGVVKVDQTNIITKISEKPEKNFFVNAGVYILNPELLEDIPKNTFFDMTDLFSQLMLKQKTAAFPIHEYWVDIGKHSDYQKASQDYNNGLI